MRFRGPLSRALAFRRRRPYHPPVAPSTDLSRRERARLCDSCGEPAIPKIVRIHELGELLYSSYGGWDFQLCSTCYAPIRDLLKGRKATLLVTRAMDEAGELLDGVELARRTMTPEEETAWVAEQQGEVDARQ